MKECSGCIRNNHAWDALSLFVMMTLEEGEREDDFHALESMRIDDLSKGGPNYYGFFNGGMFPLE